jgi:hypothetical protein
VVGGSAIALKILADDPSANAIFCSTGNLSIHAFFSTTTTTTTINQHKDNIDLIN